MSFNEFEAGCSDADLDYRVINCVASKTSL